MRKVCTQNQKKYAHKNDNEMTRQATQKTTRDIIEN